MARSAKSRNSRNTRKPVTIDLEAESVVEDEASAATDETVEAKSEPTVDQTAEPNDDNSPNGGDDEVVAPVQKSGARMSSLSGGVIGGFLALFGGAVLQWVGVLPNFAPAPAAVEQVDLTPVQSEIDNLKNEIALLRDNGNDPVTEETKVAIEQAIGASQATAEQASNLETMLQALDGKIANIETNIAAGAAGEGAGLEALADRIVGIEQQMLSASDGGEALAAVRAELSSVENGLSQLESSVAEQMAGLAAQIASAEEKLADGTSGADVATAIASAGLKSAIDRGGSFMAELEAYASVAGDTETVAELRNYAASGVATISQLADQFPSVHNRIIAVGEGLDENAGVADRLMASARSLVQVRTVGDVEGESADQISARIEARLKESDLAAALAEWESLPDAAKNASAGFADQLRARQSVDVMVAKALSGAMAATAPASN